jgi:hypothetical protein
MKKEIDINYIARLEKAITDKYGKETIQNPERFWNEEKEKEYLKQLKERPSDSDSEYAEEREGFLLSGKLFKEEGNYNCKVCKSFYKRRDYLYKIKFDCCSNCYVQYIEGREERWKSGWRPTKDGK